MAIPELDLRQVSSSDAQLGLLVLGGKLAPRELVEHTPREPARCCALM